MTYRWARFSFVAVLAAVAPARADDPRPSPTLALEAKVALRAQGGVHLEATFRAAGARKVTFFVPEFFASENFPGWHLVREDGAEFVPYAAPFQSMWTEGLQGSLVELAGEQTWKVEHDVAQFLAVGPKAGPAADLTPLTLPAGRYSVVATYAHARPEVPMGGPNFAVTPRTIEGLWTGTVESAPVTLQLALPTTVSLTIDAPREVVAGAPFVLEVTFLNGTDKAVTREGSLAISASSKEFGTFTARVLLSAEPKQVPADQTQSIVLAPGATQAFRVDLNALTFQGGRARSGPLSLTQALGQGLFALEASFATPGAKEVLAANGLWRYVQAAGQQQR